MMGLKVFAALGAAVAVAAVALAISEAGPALATHVEGAAHVFVNNPTTEPVQVHEIGAGRSYTANMKGSWVSGAALSQGVFNFSRPLAVGTVSVRAMVPPGQRVYVYLAGSTWPAASGSYYVPLAYQGQFSGFDWYEGTVTLDIGLNPSVGTVNLRRNTTTGSAYWDATVGGHLTS